MDIGEQRRTLAAFLAVVLIGGLNSIAIKFSNEDLAPFWGAALRFGAAALLLGGFALIRGIGRPRDKALVGSVVYGVLSFGAFYALVYWGLVETPAGLAMIILALVPLLTLVLAVLHRLEKFSVQSAMGSLLALAGIAIVFGDRIVGQQASLLPLVAIFLGACVNAEANVLLKLLPRSHPVANNALAMAIGFAVLLAISLIAREPAALPTQPAAIFATGYLILLGSVGLFMLFLYIIERRSASATSYIALPMPLVTVVAAAILLGEEIRPAAALGGALVIAGVYVGAFAGGIQARLPRWLGGGTRAAHKPVELETNPCP